MLGGLHVLAAKRAEIGVRPLPSKQAISSKDHVLAEEPGKQSALCRSPSLPDRGPQWRDHGAKKLNVVSGCDREAAALIKLPREGIWFLMPHRDLAEHGLEMHEGRQGVRRNPSPEIRDPTSALQRFAERASLAPGDRE